MAGLEAAGVSDDDGGYSTRYSDQANFSRLFSKIND